MIPPTVNFGRAVNFLDLSSVVGDCSFFFSSLIYFSLIQISLSYAHSIRKKAGNVVNSFARPDTKKATQANLQFCENVSLLCDVVVININLKIEDAY